MAASIYKGDLAEVTFGHETGMAIRHGHFGGVTFSIATSGDVSTITFASGSDGFFDSSSNFLYPVGMLVGSQLRVVGGGNYNLDDFATTGNIYTIVENAAKTIKVTPAMKETGASANSDEIIIDSVGTPSIDVGMLYTSSAATSDETVLTDQFVGLAATIALPETKVELLRSHVVGIGRDVVVQEPQKFVHEGGSLETMMHSARWLYYALGREAVSALDTTSGGEVVVHSGSIVKAIPQGSTYIELSSNPTSAPAVGDYVLVTDATAVDVPTSRADPASGTKWTGTNTVEFEQTVSNEIRRVVAYDNTITGAVRIHVDDPFCFSHPAQCALSKYTFADGGNTGSPNFDVTDAAYGSIDNRVSRALFSGSTLPSFSIETSMRTRDVESYGTAGRGGTQSTNVPGATNDSKQLTRVFRGCKVKGFELSANADSHVTMKADFDSLFCYTDTGRLEDDGGGNLKGDRYVAHRMFENIANTKANRKKAGIAPNTEKPFFFYNGTVTAFNTNVAQITSFSLSGNNNNQMIYTVRGHPLAETRNALGQSTEQVPFGGSRNATLNVEGKVEYELKMEIIPTDPLLYHEFRTNRTHDYTEPIKLHLVKNGAGTNREEVYIIIDDYIITEFPMPIPEDKGPIKTALTIMPKHVKVVAHDTLLHC